MDVRALMDAFAADAAAAGRAVMECNARVVSGEWTPATRRWTLNVEGGTSDRRVVTCAAVVNAAGLSAQRVSAMLGVQQSDIPALHYARGCYFEWALPGPLPFKRLVYPLPPADGAGLGVHATLNVARTHLRFGPDVAFIPALSYDVDQDQLAPAFSAAVRQYFPDLPPGALRYACAGVRPKLVGLGQPPADFAVVNHRNSLLALYGIESPGLTACMALADLAVTRLQTA
jgi:L-2-hydroxyglutarate oxidase LhgO